MIERRWVARLALLAMAVTPGCALMRSAAPPTLTDDVTSLQNQMSSLPTAATPMPSSGSLWSDAGPGAALVRDTRAFRVNDLVTIRVDESSTGANEANTNLSRKSNVAFGAKSAFGLESAAVQPGKFDLNNVLGATTDTKHDGQGKTTRTSTLTAALTTRVLRVLPNGDLVIAGQKVVMVNRDRELLTLVGSVRPVDVAADNTVPSSSVGELTVRLWGKGEVDDNAREGWFTHLMHKIWPF